MIFSAKPLVGALMWSIALCSAATVRAENIVPGAYYGAYHVDRWRQHRFGEYFFVSPDLSEQLRPVLHKPVRLEVAKVDQPINPGGAMFTAVEKVDLLPAPLKMSLRWVEPRDAAGEALRTVRLGEKAKIEVTIENSAGEEIEVGDRKHLLDLVCDIGHPPSAHYASQHQSYGAFARGKPQWSFCREPCVINPRDQVYEYPSKGLYYRDGLGERKSVQLPPAGTVSFQVTLDFRIANEFELALTLGQHSADGQEWWSYPSNFLRLDVIDERPVERDGIGLQLQSNGTDRSEAPVQLKATFTNRNDKKIRFQLSEREPLQLFAYDGDGTLISKWRDAFGGPSTTVTLPPDKQHAVSLSAPAETAMARAFFFHGYGLRDAGDGSRTLKSDFQLVSPALVLTPDRTPAGR